MASWVIPAASAFASVLVTAVIIGISVGGVTKEVQQLGERLQSVEKAQEKSRTELATQQERVRVEQAQARTDLINDRKELKSDMLREVQNLQASISLLDQKITTLAAVLSRPQPR